MEFASHYTLVKLRLSHPKLLLRLLRLLQLLLLLQLLWLQLLRLLLTDSRSWEATSQVLVHS